jgi:hydroxyacylglutathione hydrolase
MLLAGLLSRTLLGVSGLSIAGRSFVSSTFGLSKRKLVVGGAGGLVALFSSASISDSMASSTCSSFSVVQIPCLSDNYGYLLHDEVSGQTAAVDTPEAGPYRAELDRRGWKLTHIFNTHHHWDHTGGNEELKTEGVTIYGPAAESSKIPGIDVALEGGDEVEFASTKAVILDVGGHTRGHIAYYFPDLSKVFVGDSLFALGCGRMFEGTPTQFWASLQRLRQLPDDTDVYWYVKSLSCAVRLWIIFHSHKTERIIFSSSAHEYTLSNAKFAVSVEPGNADLMARYEEIHEARRLGKPTVPSRMGIEKKTNPFLRCDISHEIRRNVGVSDNDTEADAFAKVRKAKDRF